MAIIGLMVLMLGAGCSGASEHEIDEDNSKQFLTEFIEHLEAGNTHQAIPMLSCAHGQGDMWLDGLSDEQTAHLVRTLNTASLRAKQADYSEFWVEERWTDGTATQWAVRVYYGKSDSEICAETGIATYI
mgnify:FL=1